MNELISILIPTYNVSNYIDECIISVLNQSYKEIEIIVVDDNSTDDTYEKLVKWTKFDSRIKLYKNSENIKIAATLNKALKLSSGNYIARMDGDDVCDIDRIKIQYQFLMSNPQFDLVGSDCCTIDESGMLIGQTIMIHDSYVLCKTLKLSSPVLHIWLTKREVYLKLGGYRNIPGVEDYDFLLRMNTLGLSFKNLPLKLYSVRIRVGNTASANGLRQRLLARYVVNLYKFRLKNGFDLHSIDRMESYVKSSALAVYLHSYSHKFTIKAIKAKNKKHFILTVLYLLLASFLSVRQFEYFTRKLFLLIIKKIYI